MAERSDAHNGDIFDEARDVVEDGQQLADDVEDVYERIRETADIRHLYDRNPYAVLAAAAGAGYVLGGGLFTPFTKRILKTGMKALFVPLALSKLRGLTQEIAKQGELDELGEELTEP